MIAVAPAPEPEPTVPYITGAAATRLAGISASRLQRLAVLKKIRVELPPGEPPRYSREDIERLLEARD